jgi:diguanylate cyclase (GGDEF)-like protein/PAS domain S-box-containing protein
VKTYRSISLRLWLPIIILGALLLMMTLGSLWRYQLRMAELEQASIDLLEIRLGRDQRYLESLLRTGQTGLVAEVIAELGALPDMEFAVLVDEYRQVLYGSHPLWPGQAITQALVGQDLDWLPAPDEGRRLVFSADRKLLNAYQPLQLMSLPGEIRSDRTGAIVLQYSLQNGQAEVRRNVMRNSLVNLAIGALVMVLMMWLLDRWLARPLSYLRDRVGQISQGHFDTDIRIVGEGELASLAAAVNRMQVDLASMNASRTQSQKELAQFKNTLDQVLDGVIIASTEDFRFLYVNQGAQRQLGYTEAELLGLSPLDIKPDGDPVSLRERMQPLLDGRIPALSFESQHRHKSGHIFPVEIFLQLIHLDGEASRFVAIVRDITARKYSEAELRASEARFRVLFEQAAVGVAVIETASCRFIRINKKYADIVGYSVVEMLQMDFAMITYPADLAPDLAHIERLKAGEIREFTMEKRYIRKDGSICWVNLTVSPMWEAGAPVDYHVAVVEDITARKHSEALLSSQMAVLEMIARRDPLDHILGCLIRAVEAQAADMLCSILLLDASGKHLRHCAAPSLPAAYREAINGSPIGESAGSCGAAAFRGQPVIVTDIATDPLWKDYAHLALAHNLRACWSTPIFSATQQVLGTFAVYYRQPTHPTAEHQQIIAMATHTAAIAIEREQSEAALRDGAEYTQTILDNVADGIITTDIQGTIESYNNAATRIFGFAADEVIGQFVNKLMPDLFADTPLEATGRIPATGLERVLGKRREIEGLRKDGTYFPMELSVSRVLYNGQVKLIGLVSDISERRLHEERIQRLAFYDPLTELPNRRLLMDRLQHALASSTRNGALGALLLLDLDHFKNLNDTHGHDAGDLLLCQVAERLTRCVREGDTVARLGGDEFVIVLEGLSVNVHEAAARAKAVGEHILSLLSQTYLLDEIEHYSSPSIGITLFSQHAETVDALLKRADVAMYQAKAAGRNTLQFFDSELQASLAARTALEADMRLGLAQQQFLLHYQPQVDGEGHITGAEALLRWQHPLKGMISPADFIPLAEQSGFILPLGQWVLQTACEQLVAWAKQPATAALTLAINVSARQFRQIGFVEQVMDVIQQTGADPTRVKLELTESLLVNNLDDVVGKMRALKSCGVGFALDDFGTGYSSLGYLRQLPLDQLKIDQSFVRDVLVDPNDAVIARTIIALAISLGLSVIAEGVETEGQRSFLATNGCYAYQGYLFGRPMPVQGFEKMLAQISVL